MQKFIWNYVLIYPFKSYLLKITTKYSDCIIIKNQIIVLFFFLRVSGVRIIKFFQPILADIGFFWLTFLLILYSQTFLKNHIIKEDSYS